jgi:hypothetical protein
MGPSDSPASLSRFSTAGNHLGKILFLPQTKRAILPTTSTMCSRIIDDAAEVSGYESLRDPEQILLSPTATVQQENGSSTPCRRQNASINEPRLHCPRFLGRPHFFRSRCHNRIKHDAVTQLHGNGFKIEPELGRVGEQFVMSIFQRTTLRHDKSSRANPGQDKSNQQNDRERHPENHRSRSETQGKICHAA